MLLRAVIPATIRAIDGNDKVFLTMGRFGWTVIAVVALALAADHYWNDGYYAGHALAMLGEIRHSFRW